VHATGRQMARCPWPRRGPGRLVPRHDRRSADLMTSAVHGGNTELALADTSLFIAMEQERPLSDNPPERVAVSVVTIGELRLGVLAAENGTARAQRRSEEHT